MLGSCRFGLHASPALSAGKARPVDARCGLARAALPGEHGVKTVSHCCAPFKGVQQGTRPSLFDLVIGSPPGQEVKRGSSLKQLYLRKYVT